MKFSISKFVLLVQWWESFLNFLLLPVTTLRKKISDFENKNILSTLDVVLKVQKQYNVSITTESKKVFKNSIPVLFAPKIGCWKLVKVFPHEWIYLELTRICLSWVTYLAFRITLNGKTITVWDPIQCNSRLCNLCILKTFLLALVNFNCTIAIWGEIW